MTTSPYTAGIIALASAVTLASCATSRVDHSVRVAVETTDGAHLRISSVYAHQQADEFIVHGTVRKALLWRGGVDGHLDVTAFSPGGAVVGCKAVRWTGVFPRHGVGAVHYGARWRSDVARKVARVAVAYAPGRHAGRSGECHDR